MHDLLILAQAAADAGAQTAAGTPADTTVFGILSNVFGRPDTLAQPQDLLMHLQQLSVVWATIFLAAGLVCLLNGYRFYKTVTIILALLIGACTGYYLGSKVEQGYIVAGCLAALLAVGCWPLMKYAVAAMGGLAGAFLGANAWSAVLATVETSARPDPAQQTYWIGALIGLIVCGMLAFILFKLSIVLFTAVSGATIAMLGGLALLLQVPAWREPITTSLQNNALVLPLLMIVPAVIGLIIQQSQPEPAKPAAASPKPA